MLAFDSPRFRPAEPNRDLVIGRNVLPSWSLALLAAALTLPALVAAVDAVARARRRRAPVGEWVGWALGAATAFGIVAVAAIAFELVDWLPGSIEEAVAPATAPSFGEAAPPLVALALLLALAWITVRRLFAAEAHLRDPVSGAAAIALMLAVEVMVVCALNPYAGLLLVPAAHLSLLGRVAGAATKVAAGAGDPRGGARAPRPGAALLRRASGSGPVAGQLCADAGERVQRLARERGAWVIGGRHTRHPPCWSRLARAGPEAPSEVTVRGPVTYAGPGSLGGTESALRR